MHQHYTMITLTLSSAHLRHLSKASMRVSSLSGTTMSTTVVVPPASAALVPWQTTTGYVHGKIAIISDELIQMNYSDEIKRKQ